MKRYTIYCLAVALMAALVLPLLSMSSSRADDSFYVSDQKSNTVSKFNANNGNFQGVLITAAAGGTSGGNFTPTGIVVNRVSPPELVVANQNADTPLNGEIRVFDEATGALKRVLVPASDPNAPFAPFAILLNGSELLIADEAGRVEVFNATTTPATFLQDFSTTGYVNANNFHPFGMVVGPGWQALCGQSLGRRRRRDPIRSNHEAISQCLRLRCQLPLQPRPTERRGLRA